MDLEDSMKSDCKLPAFILSISPQIEAPLLQRAPPSSIGGYPQVEIINNCNEFSVIDIDATSNFVMM